MAEWRLSVPVLSEEGSTTARDAEGTADVTAVIRRDAAVADPVCIDFVTKRCTARAMLGSVAVRSAGLIAEHNHSETSAGANVPDVNM